MNDPPRSDTATTPPPAVASPTETARTSLAAPAVARASTTPDTTAAPASAAVVATVVDTPVANTLPESVATAAAASTAGGDADEPAGSDNAPVIAILSDSVTAAAGDSSAIGTPVQLRAQEAATEQSGELEDAAEAGMLTLAGEAVDSTWVQIQWDGVDGIEEVIPRGQRRRWQAREFFMVTAGRAHGVRFSLDGKLLGDGRLGEPTEVLRFRASKDRVTLLSRDLQPLSQLSVEHDIASD